MRVSFAPTFQGVSPPPSKRCIRLGLFYGTDLQSMKSRLAGQFSAEASLPSLLEALYACVRRGLPSAGGGGVGGAGYVLN